MKEAFEKWFDDFHKDCDEKTYKYCAMESWQEAIEWYKNNQWISVEDRLPENERPVLLVLFDDFTYSFGKNDGDDWYGLDWLKFYEKEVTHWMPIPELKGDDK